jgi:hypothetical protein
MHTGFWRENLKRYHYENLRVGRRAILKLILEKCDGIDLAQDRDQWRALVNMAMNIRIP